MNTAYQIMHSNRAPLAATRVCSRLGMVPTARARCLRNNWFNLLQLPALSWARGRCFSSGPCRPFAPAHFTRGSPEGWLPPGSSGLMEAEQVCLRNDSIPNAPILLILIKFKFMATPREWAFWLMNLQHEIYLKRKDTVYSKNVSPSLVAQIL